MLNTFTRNVTSDGWVVRLARNLIDLIDVNNTYLGLVYVIVTFLKKLLNNVLDILTNITCFGQRCCISNGEWNIQQSSKRFGE